MEPLIVLAVLALFVLLFVGAIMGILAKGRASVLERRMDGLAKDVRELRTALRRAETPDAAAPPGPEREPPPAEAAAAPVAVGPEREPLPAAPAVRPAPAAEPTPEPEPAPWPEPEPEPELRPASAPVMSAAPPPPLPATPVEPAAGIETPDEAPAGPVPAAPPAVSSRPTPFAGVEQALGLRWLTWVGVALLFLGVAFFLKYAYDRDWLGRFFGPHLRIASAATVALALAFCGWRSLRGGMVALGQGLLGGGQAMLYLTIFAAFQPAVMVVETPLIGKTVAFGLMALVTAGGLLAAVRLDAIAMAFLAVLGGLAAPVMVSSGQDSRDALCAYLLVLDLGVLGVAAWRRWRALDLLAFAGTVLLFAGWYYRWSHLHPWPDAVVVWLLVFHLVFLLLPFAHHWRQRTAVTVERFALALANLAWTLAYGAWILREPAPRLLAAGCLVGAALYLGLGIAMARRVGDDRRTRDGFVACAALLLTLGLFYLLPVDGISTAWFVEATALLWLGYRYGNVVTRHAALVVVAVALARTCIVHLPAVPGQAVLVGNRWFVTLLIAAVGLGAFAWVHRRFARSAGERGLASTCGVVAGYWALAVGSLEILREADEEPAAWSGNLPALAVAGLQLVGAFAFLGWVLRMRTRPAWFAAFLPLLAGAVAVGLAYDRYPATALVALNGCCLLGLGVCALLAVSGVVARRALGEESLRDGLLGLFQLALYALATVETAAWLQRGDEPASGLTLRQALAWVWLASAVAGGVVAAARSSRRVLAVAAVPLALAVMLGFALFADELEPHRLIANQRFVFALLCSAVVVAAAWLLRRLAHARAGEHVAAAALLLLLAYAAGEAVTWSFAHFQGRAVTSWIVWLLGVVTVLGAAGGCWRARATDNASLRSVALAALFGAAVLPLAVYATEWDAAWMFWNLRAALVTAAIAALLWCGRGSPSPGLLRWVAYVVALLALTLEPPVWFWANVTEAGEARRLSLFAVTVTWVVAASSSLAVGFLRDQRPLRLVALALFALTAAKLLVLDMSGAQQLYRILAFVLVGLVFVGASWGYHRVERRLAAKREE